MNYFTIKRGNYTVSKTIRIPEDINEKLGMLAAKNNISFNKLTVQCIYYALEHLDEENMETPFEKDMHIQDIH